ncbi:hypothetical protein BS78_06G067900 [Paspalum vaginatum]|nr:hypothetical protein BS78_06G067900 [Paspalum vaginatum]
MHLTAWTPRLSPAMWRSFMRPHWSPEDTRQSYHVLKSPGETRRRRRCIIPSERGLLSHHMTPMPMDHLCPCRIHKIQTEHRRATLQPQLTLAPLRNKTTCNNWHPCSLKDPLGKHPDVSLSAPHPIPSDNDDEDNLCPNGRVCLTRCSWLQRGRLRSFSSNGPPPKHCVDAIGKTSHQADTIAARSDSSAGHTYALVQAHRNYPRGGRAQSHSHQ